MYLINYTAMKKIAIVSIVLVVFFLNSCNKDVLNKAPLDVITELTLWSDSTLIDAFVNQVYAEMTFFTSESGTSYAVTNDYMSDDTWSGMFLITNVSDEARNAWDGNGWSFKNGGLRINGGLLEWWGYRTVRKLNDLITRLPNSPVSNQYKRKRIAETRFLRAFAYFAMVKRYGGVPLITRVQDLADPEDVLMPARDREEAIYDFVIAEVDEIYAELPETVSGGDLGRPSRYAALALKSRAALYAASIAQFGSIQSDGILGVSDTRAEEFYQKCIAASELIISGGKHALYERYPEDRTLNYRRLFTDKNNVEVIFAKNHNSVNFQNGGLGIGYDFFQAPRPNPWESGNVCAPYLEMAESYEYMDGRSGNIDRGLLTSRLWTIDELWGDKDPRFKASIYTQNTVWKGRSLSYHQGIQLPDGTIRMEGSYNGVLWRGEQNINTTGFGVLKYLDENYDNNTWGSSSTSWQVFRYGEILLNLAEAAFEVGDESTALTMVNRIRERAGMPALASVTRERIRRERKVELAFEGHRYWDLRRWRTAEYELSMNNSGLRYVLDGLTGKYRLIVKESIDGLVNPPRFHPHNYYLPITLSRTGQNPNLIENPNY